MATVPIVPSTRRPSRGLNIALWVLQVLLAAAFLMAGASKLAGAEMMVAQFEKLGLGQWFRYLTGVLEVVAAILLVIPGRGGYGAILLVPIMIGAAAAHLVVFHDNPTPPLVLLVLASFVAWGRLARPRPSTTLVD